MIVDDNTAIHDDFKQLLSGNPKKDSSLNKLEESLFGSDGQNNEPENELSYEIDSAYQGIDAVELVKKAVSDKKPYAMAFVDMRMPPGIDGLETIRQIWEIAPQTEIVLCTAYSDHSLTEISEYLKDTQRLLLLKKPFDPVEIRQMAASLTAKWNYAFEAKYYLENVEELLESRTKSLDEERAMRIEASKLASLGEMAGGIAHEINNPLGIISGNANRLIKLSQKDQCNSEQAIEIGQKISDTCARISRIINSMLAIAHNNPKGIFESTPVKVIIDETLNLFHEKFKSLGIDVQLEGFDSEVTIDCDHTKISQVFINLINNAHDAILESESDPKWVKIKLDENDSNIEIRFIDSGNGIPNDVQDKILEPFFTTKDVGKGTGLGLSLAQSYMTDHKGELSLDKSSENTCFLVKINKKAS